MTAGPALEMWSRQTGSEESTSGTYIVTRQRAFTVLIDVGDTIDAAYGASGLPFVGDPYPGTFYCFCIKRTAQRVSPIMAIVEVDYKGEAAPGDPNGNPIGGDPILEWGCSVTDEAIDTDADGNPIENANGEKILGITERLADDVLMVERNFLTINRYAIRAYRRAVNSDTFYGWPPGTCRMMDDRARAVFNPAGGVAFWRVSATFQFREPYNTTADKAWYKRVLHEGMKERATAGGPVGPAIDKLTKSLSSTPVKLRANGTQLGAGETAIWLQFRTLNTLPFSALGLS